MNNSKKKIHLVSTGYAMKGHSKEYVINFCKYLNNKFDIILYIASNQQIETPDNIQVNYINIDFTKNDAEKFYKYKFLAPYVRALSVQRDSFSFYKKMLNLNQIKPTDNVFLLSYSAISLIYIIAKLKTLEANSYLWIHSARFQSKDLIYTLYKIIFKNLFKYYFKKKLKGIIANGDFISNSLQKNLAYPKNKIHTIQYVSEIKSEQKEKNKSREELGISIDLNVVLFFGMLRTDKNIEVLIKSVAQSKTKPLLIIAGSEASVSKTEISNWIKKYNLEKFLLDIEYIDDEKLSLYYSCSDVLLLTYKEGSASQSGPLSLAREFSLPSIVTDTGEIGYYVKSNRIGLTANPEIENSFSMQIDNFFNNDVKQIEYRKNLLKIKKLYSWEQASLKYEEIFNKK